MKVLFVNDSTSNANWGDRAAAISLKEMVTRSGGEIIGIISEEELGGSNFQNEISAEAGEQPDDGSYLKEKLKLFIPPVVLKLRDKLRAQPQPAAADDIIPKKWEEFDTKLQYLVSNRERYRGLLDSMESSDLLVMHGDGCMTGNGRIPRAELFLAYLAKRHFSKAVIIVNHTADFGHPVLDAMARQIYPLLDDVVYRETISYEKNRGLCNGSFAPDSAYYFQPMPSDAWLSVAKRPTYFDVWPDTALFDPAEPYICIGGSGIYFYNRDYDAVLGFSQLIEHIASIYRGKIVLTVSDLRDQGIFRPIAEKYGLPLIGLTTPVQQSVDIIGNAQAYIGGRWHPSIFALRGGTPIISISTNTFMMQALAEMTGSSKAFDALNLEEEKVAIGRRLQDCLEQGPQLRRKLGKWAAKAHEQSWDNVKFLRDGARA